MANTVIQLKKSAIPSQTPNTLANGELAINYADGKLFYKDTTGIIQQISSGNSFATINAAGTFVVADLPNDILTLDQGNNIIITGDSINDKITIAANLIPAFDYANTISGGGGGGDKTYTFEQSTAPATANAADLWVNTDTGVVYQNFGTNTSPVWAEFGPTGVSGSLAPGIVYTSNLVFTDATYQTTAAMPAAYSQAAFNKANSANLLAYGTGIGANAYTDTVVVANLVIANAYSRVFANSVGSSANANLSVATVSANNFANTKLANTTGTLAGSLTVTGNTTVNGIAPNYAPNRPAFRVYGSGTTNNLTTTQNGTGCLTSNNWTVSFNQGTYLANTNGVFTAPVAGLYQVCVIGRNSGYASGISQIGVTKNGSSGGTVGGECILMVEFAASSSMNHAGGSTIINLAVGDTLACKILAGQINFDGNDNWSVAYIG